MSNVQDNECKFRIAVLKTVKSAQAQNGLRHGDFQRYRQYCARRLRRIRKSVKFTHSAPKSKSFIPRKLDPELVSDAKFLLLPLYNAERAWSYAMQLREDDKANMEVDGEDDANSRLKFHLIGRFKKAVYWSNCFLQLCTEKADVRTICEAEAYCNNMKANLYLYNEEWTTAAKFYTTTQQIYLQLCKVGSVEDQDLLNQLLEDLVPYLRYCDYNTGGSSKSSNAIVSSEIEDKLEELISSRSRSQKKTTSAAKELVVFDWLDTPISLQHNPELAIAILKTLDYEAKLHSMQQSDLGSIQPAEKKLTSLYVELFRSFDNAIRVLHLEEKKYGEMASGLLVEKTRRMFQFLGFYLNFQKLHQMLGRNLSLMIKMAKTSHITGQNDLLHICDVLVHNTQQLIDILEVTLQKHHDLEDNTSSTILEAKLRKMQFAESIACSLRTYYVAEYYLYQEKFGEAGVLFERALNFFEHSSSLTGNTDAQTDFVSIALGQLFSQLKRDLPGAISRTLAVGLLASQEATTETQQKFDQLSLDEETQESSIRTSFIVSKSDAKSNLAKFDTGVKMTKVQAERLLKLHLNPVSNKPLLFDIAFTELKFPDVKDMQANISPKIKDKKKPEDIPSAGGLFSWLRR